MSTALKFIDIGGTSREEWLQLRTGGIGGSDVAAICGLSRWKTAVHVYLEKIGEAPNDEQSEAAYWGTVMEPILAAEFEKRSGYRARKLDSIMVHPENDWAYANVDRVITEEELEAEDPGILECKTGSEFLHAEWLQEQIPPYYMTQFQWYLYVSGLRWGHFATLIGGNKFYMPRVERDDAVIEYLVKLCSNFWHNHVLRRVPPPFDGSNASTDLVKKLYANAEPGTQVDLDGQEDAEALITQLLTAKADLKDAEKREAEAENRLKDMMKEKEVALFRGRPAFTWKGQNDTRVDTISLRAAHPDIYEKFVSTKTVRKFLPKIKGV